MNYHDHLVNIGSLEQKMQNSISQKQDRKEIFYSIPLTVQVNNFYLSGEYILYRKSNRVLPEVSIVMSKAGSMVLPSTVVPRGA